MDIKKKKPVRIAHIIGKLNAAGVEAVMNNYYRNIDHRKYQFDFFVDADGQCQPPQDLIDMGARYYIIPPYQNLPKHLYVLYKYLKNGRYKIVHSGMNTLAVFSLFVAWLAKIPVRINHSHSTAGRGEYKRNVLKYALRPFAKLFATDYCACSRYAGEWLFGKREVRKKKVTIFNNAIDVEKYHYNPKVREEVRKELGLEGKFVVGHVGRFCYQKNHNFLIDIFEAICKEEPEAVLLLTGIGELQDDIKNKVRALGLEKKVHFLGVRKDVDRLYQAMDVFVLPSFYEGLPVVGVEAQTAGLPCILSDQMTEDTSIIKETIMIPLTESARSWAKTILACRDIRRRDTTSDINKAGFNIKIEAKKMESYYDKLLKRCLQREANKHK